MCYSGGLVVERQYLNNEMWLVPSHCGDLFHSSLEPLTSSHVHLVLYRRDHYIWDLSILFLFFSPLWRKMLTIYNFWHAFNIYFCPPTDKWRHLYILHQKSLYFIIMVYVGSLRGVMTGRGFLKIFLLPSCIMLSPQSTFIYVNAYHNLRKHPFAVLK